MLNITQIKKIREEDTLKVTISVKKRASALERVETIDTDYVISTICKDYKIKKTLKTPTHGVGNTSRRGIKQEGSWSFLLTSTPIEEAKEDPKPRRPRKKTTPTTNDTSKNEPQTKKSFRGRLSKIANKPTNT